MCVSTRNYDKISLSRARARAARGNLLEFRAVSNAWFLSRSPLLIFSVALLPSRWQVSSSRASLSCLFFVSFRRPQIQVSLQSQINLLSASKTRGLRALISQSRYFEHTQRLVSVSRLAAMKRTSLFSASLDKRTGLLSAPSRRASACYRALRSPLPAPLLIIFAASLRRRRASFVRYE